jgi:hypothetical protein
MIDALWSAYLAARGQYIAAPSPRHASVMVDAFYDFALAFDPDSARANTVYLRSLLQPERKAA